MRGSRTDSIQDAGSAKALDTQPGTPSGDRELDWIVDTVNILSLFVSISVFSNVTRLLLVIL